MTNLLIAGMVGLVVGLLGTPIAVRAFRARGWGQMIRQEGPQAHYEKAGTPTMGGLVIMLGAVAGYAVGHVGVHGFTPFRDSGVLAVCTIVCFGLLGFLDDFIKIYKARSLGLHTRAKFIGQAVIAVTFGVLAVKLVHIGTDLSFFRSTAINLGIVFYLWVFVMISASSNGVNLADGLDGLAVGSAAPVLAVFVVIGFWEFRHPAFYDVGRAGSDPFELAVLSAALFGACSGFLWWNTAPAKIFMGDTGALMIGGSMAVFAILYNTQLLLIILGGLYVVETLSVMAQVAMFRTRRKRVFLMAPIHHHFELLGWQESTVIVRFWVLSGLSAAFGLGLFYADYLGKVAG